MRKTNSVRVWLSGTLTALVLLTVAGAGRADSTPDPLFGSDDVLEVSLTGDLRAISRDRKEEPESRPGTLSYTDANGQQVTLNVMLEPRGKSRRTRKVCTFPPLWVEFDKAQVGDTLFAKQKRLKMVTYCRSPESFQDYVLKEYLAYRIFNVLSDQSFRVRLLRVAFTEQEGGRDPLVRYGFFIEHKGRLAKRLDARVAEPAERISPQRLEPEQAAIAALFQFMVSNTDFSFIAPPVDDVCCHNAVLLEPKGEPSASVLYHPVPYDFDRTGLVDPPNGLPAAELGQRSFRDRVYRGFCREPQLDEAVAKTLAARPAIEALVREQADLGSRSREQALRFLASYYEQVEDPGRRDRALKCRELP